jgi:hypothetical protein
METVPIVDLMFAPEELTHEPNELGYLLVEQEAARLDTHLALMFVLFFWVNKRSALTNQSRMLSVTSPKH